MKFTLQILALAAVSLLIAGQALAQVAGSSGSLSELEQLLSTEIGTASRYGQKASEAPSSISIITAEDIARFGYKTLADALNNLSGFYSTYDRNYTFIGTRGFSRPGDFNNRIRILLNGHSIHEAMDGSTFAGNELAFSLDAVERVEVVRGPSSALYGTGAMFAVINIITKDCKAVEGLMASSSAGSFGSREFAALFSKRLSAANSFIVSGRVADNDGQSLYFKEFDLATSNHGLAERRDWEKGHALVASAKFGDFGLETMYSSREKGVPTASYETIFNAEQSRSADVYGFVDAHYGRQLTAATGLTLRGYFDKYVYKGWWPYEADNTTRDETNGESLGGEALITFDAAVNNRILAAAEFQTQLKSRYKYWGDSSGLLNSIDEPLDVFSFTVQDEYRPLHSLSLLVGLRHDQYQNQGGYTAPRIGVVFSPTDHTSLKALFGRAFRVPTSMERFYEDPNAGFKPNPGLEAENILTREVVVEHQVNSVLQLTTSVYSYTLDGLADYVIDPADSLAQLQNSESIDAIGGEFALRAEFSQSLSAFANGTVQKTEDTESKERLSNSPATMIKIGIWSAFLRHFSGSAIVRYESERTTVYDTRIGSFLLADLQLAAQPKFAETSGAGAVLNKFRLALLVRNAFNESYSNPGGFEHVQDAIPQDGRTFQVKLTYKL